MTAASATTLSTTAPVALSGTDRARLHPVGNMATLERRVVALETERNAAHCTIHWQFSSQDARTKLANLYPVKRS